MLFLTSAVELRAASPKVFDVRDYGATGRKADDARGAIQKAVDACAKAGGGLVRFPPGLYTSGTIHLHSHVRIHLDSGATIFASSDTNAYDCGPILSKAALFYGEDLEDIALEGSGIIDGQQRYEWRLDDFEEHYEHKTWMQELGKPLMRSFPAGFPARQLYPHLVWLGHCKNIRVTGLNFLNSPSWTITLYACSDAAFEHLYIYSSLKEAVWADGIDLDGCRDISITDCAIETGDDCVALISEKYWGPPRPCQNIRISKCRLSSASAGVKFSEGNWTCIRNIDVRDTLFNNVNRGFAFNSGRGGSISNITMVNLRINCNRFDWFWVGEGQPFRFLIKRRSELEHEPPEPGEPPPGPVRNLILSNVVAYAKGSSLFHGHPESWLEGIRLENVTLFLSADPTAPYDKAVHALDFHQVKNLVLKNVEVGWEQPTLQNWRSALNLDEVQNLEIAGFVGRGAWPRGDAAALNLKQVSGAKIHDCRAPEGTDVFVEISGAETRNVRLYSNDLRGAKIPLLVQKDVPSGAVQTAKAASRQ